ncbi:MAG: hypothetical protein AAFO82_21965 [Bacteroidota bacterium]
MKTVLWQRMGLVFLLVGLYNCASDKENLLLGRWNATQLTENGNSIEMELEEVWFTFDEQGHYQFHSTLNYREAGFYKQNNNLLYTTDTLIEDRNRQAVKILKLDEAHLELGMEDRGKKRVLSLMKANKSEE